MTNIDIAEMALKAGFKEHNGMIYVTTINDDCAKELERFAALVASLIRADEREACANAMARIVMTPTLTHGALVKLSDVVNAIRARGETK